MIRFFTKHTVAPAAGPMLKAAINAGISERSILIKAGIKGTLKLIIISTADMADSIPVAVIYRIL